MPVPLAQFHPVIARWFEEKFGSPTEPQARGWPAIRSGAHTLIAAPTGSGKTFAAFLAALDGLVRDGLDGRLKDETRVVYVSPLKALSNDIHKNLEEPLRQIREALTASHGHDVEVRAQVRTGDTPTAQRQAMLRKPPHVLVTTPESLYLLLTSASGAKLLQTARTLIVDEIHATVGNRRGAHLALSMERLEALTKAPLQRIGLSATQKPIEEVARFLVGSRRVDPNGKADCAVIDCGYARKMDLAIETPASPLEAVMSNEVWEEVYRRLADLIEAHRTTLVFVNTRRLAERVTHHLATLLGEDKVTSHHGSLSAKLRLEAENRLKRGELKALVATASLELGIDIGSVELVCQIGPTRSIATLLQRVGRARHQRGGLPKGRLFPLSRDELIECVATIRSVDKGDLDRLEIPPKPLDVLAQQIVACAAREDWDVAHLYQLMSGAWPFHSLSRPKFDAVVRMLAQGFSTKRGRRAALIHHDAINHRLRARRGAGLLALTSGGAIPDNADYRVLLEPSETFIGTVNEDFAVESMAGDVFQLGNASWRMLRINAGTIRVEDAHGEPPGIPFWLGEAPGRTKEVSRAVSDLRVDIANRIRQEQTSPARADSIRAWLVAETGLAESAARQMVDYLVATHEALGVLPSQKTLVIERFFDESGGMQLVIHSPFGIRINRAWGLALRKRFCRSFNFELQAAATDDAIVLSLGTQHSFPLEEVFRYLSSKTVRPLLVQALLDAPMFPVRWRWNASRALALPRMRSGRKVPAPLQRMEAENLLAAVFPDQLACLENIAGDREVPDHPLVQQTIDDCLNEAMDVDGLVTLLRKIETGAVECIARDLPEPSPLAHEILNAKPYAFLDNAPLEERRTQAVHTRRATDPATADDLGRLDIAAIEKVQAEAWPTALSADELHEALMLAGAMTWEELARVGPSAKLEDGGAGSSPRTVPGTKQDASTPGTGTLHAPQLFAAGPEASPATLWLQELVVQRRAGRLAHAPPLWVAAERLPMLRAVFPGCQVEPPLTPPESELRHEWERSAAIRELVRGRLEITGPTSALELSGLLNLPAPDIEVALLALEAEGFVLRGRFRPRHPGTEWCDRRLLARIHRLTINRLRAEIEPVSAADFFRFLAAWQRAEPGRQTEGVGGVQAVLELLDGYELPAGAWEPEVLALRVKDYAPEWLDQLCFTGRIGWGRLSAPRDPNNRTSGPLRSSRVALFAREHLSDWLELARSPLPGDLSADTQRVLDALANGGASFFSELQKRVGLLPSRLEQALAELAALGWVTADSFEGLRALLLPQEKRVPFSDPHRKRRHKAVSSVEFAGRWSLLRAIPGQTLTTLGNAAPTAPHKTPVANIGQGPEEERRREQAVETLARGLLRRYGLVFRRLLERESLPVTWYELGRVYRRWEARGEIRGGYFVGGVSGEQFALPEAVGLLRSIRKQTDTGRWVVVSGADPLNLAGILTPGRRVSAIASNRILFRDGVPIAALEAGELVRLDTKPEELGREVESALRMGTMSPALRPYYG